MVRSTIELIRAEPGKVVHTQFRSLMCTLLHIARLGARDSDMQLAKITAWHGDVNDSAHQR